MMLLLMMKTNSTKEDNHGDACEYQYPFRKGDSGHHADNHIMVMTIKVTRAARVDGDYDYA
jgi:hypothetical protein